MMLQALVAPVSIRHHAFSISDRRSPSALSRADGGGIGVAIPAALPPLWGGRRRHGVPVGGSDPPGKQGDTGKAALHVDERPIGVQIFGADPEGMGDAAALVTEVFEPEFIDINFGCPVKKVVRRNGGSGCLKDLDLVQTVIRSVASHTHLPVTVKIRSGWSEEMRDPVTIALRCQDAGARALALHPRTRTQMYSGAGAVGRDRRGGRRARHSGDRQWRHQDGRGRRSTSA